LGPQPIDHAQEILANAPIAQALAVPRRIGAVRTVRPARAERLATGRPRTETDRLRPGAGDTVGQRDVRQPAQLLELDISDRLPDSAAEGRGSLAGDIEQPHSAVVEDSAVAGDFGAVEDSEAVAGDSAAAEAVVVGVDRT